MKVDAIGWQEIAHALTRVTTKPRNAPRRARGPRKIPQETVNQIRADSNLMSRADVAAKHGVSIDYVYQVVECGLRDEEREQLRR